MPDATELRPTTNHEDYIWSFIHHGAMDDAPHNRVSLHLRQGGTNYHIGLLLPKCDIPLQMARLNLIVDRLNDLHAIGGDVFKGTDLLRFPEPPKVPV